MKLSLTVKNIASLYGMSIAKLIIPLLTLPYLTRVLSVDTYGVVTYVRSIFQYAQIAIDFGFMISGTKDIVNAKDKNELEKENSEIFTARFIVSMIMFLAVALFALMLPILKNFYFFTLISVIPAVLSIFLFDYLFRGLEKMHVVTLRFITMKSISTLLTFLFVRSDKDLLFIPVLDIIGTLIAILLVMLELKKLKIKFYFSGYLNAFKKLKSSAICFASNMATTTFGALNTLVIGYALTAKDVAYWGVCMQIIGAIQTMYSPITDGIYPSMIKNKSLKLIKTVMLIFMPVISIGCVFMFFTSEFFITFIAGKQYLNAASICNALLPTLVFSFPAMLLGWPTLGAVGKEKHVMKTTVFSGAFQVLGLVILLLFNNFNLFSLSILRCGTEFLLMAFRSSYVLKFKNEFNVKKSI